MASADPGASSISVVVRVRPFTIREAAQIQRIDDSTLFLGDGSLAGAPQPKLKSSGIRSVIKVVDERCLVFDPPEDNPVQKFSRSVVPQGKKVKDQVFAFDRVFDDNTTQSEVYEATTKTLLDSVLDGYNATVFAYGATGCGKTHTITGTAQMPGIIFLTMQELFEKIADRSDEKHTEVSLSYLEIYNETIRDLLVPGGSKQGLMLREDSNQAVTVAGLTSHKPKDVQEVMDMIVQGNEYRTVSPTEANATSSRSHAVIQINIAQKDRNAPVNEPYTMATLSIIDLAGSERASATKNRGERLLEGANINKSLLALGSCINALCDPRKKNHIPYRNSKLTRLLKFSLGGNCKTVMIVCVSPSSVHFDETQNTLRYANRAKNIQTKVTRNVFNVNRHVKDFLVKIDEQMALINELKAQQKDAEKIFFAKFRKQAEKADGCVREGVQRIRAAYDNSSSERQEKVAHMKKLRGIERRIGLLSSWIAAFDTICDTRGDENAMPANLSALRKTAHGIMLELENSRYHLHQKLDKTHWERAIDVALQHSINQLPAGAGEFGEIERLELEAELLKSKFTREAYREVLQQDKTGDAGTLQVLLTAQFEILTALSDTSSMNEDEAVAHAKGIINKLLDTGFTAAGHVVKPDSTIPPVETFAPAKRGLPKRRRSSTAPRELLSRAVQNPRLAAVAEDETTEYASPMKGSPRRRKAGSARKSVSFTPVKKKSPSKRAVRWRDDDGESGTLADFALTPRKYESTPEQSSPERTLLAAPAAPAYLENDSMDESSPSLVIPEATSLPAAKPNRFQAGFLSKSRPSMGIGSPNAGNSSIIMNSTEPDERPSPLRSLDLAKAANIRSPRTRIASLSPRPSVSPSSSLPVPSGFAIASMSTVDENQPPSSDSESSSMIDPSKLRSALHASKRRDRLSSATFTVPAGSSNRRVSSISSIGGSTHRQNHNHSGPLSSSANGISRLRRGSAERRRSPPISCSPSDLSVREAKSFTPGQARRMNFGGSVRGAIGSPGEHSDAAEAGRTTRRITIGGAAMGGAARRGDGRGNIVWR
ncbi:kinesin motor domain-containing protein [Microdochium trichocladiopsis]|uniref:Kinesin motor domain-containing protein n=1 Tax=Microdochium trichocladiopsis TaxID=1682393 RepID=A0A9P8YA23_9PEZI|nr:kinesin motor domain-containing protein [Microdochium trichocladiopsis]KAH7034688.1 kinesin motor domain-containing protein [Microdochium trichocladiopsis]